MKNRLVRWIIYIAIGVSIGAGYGHFKKQKEMDGGVIALSPDTTEEVSIPTRGMEGLSAAKDAVDAAMNTGKEAIESTTEAGQEAVGAALNVGQDAVDGAIEAGKSIIEETNDALQAHGIEAPTTVGEVPAEIKEVVAEEVEAVVMEKVTDEAETVVDSAVDNAIDANVEAVTDTAVDAAKENLTPMP